MANQIIEVPDIAVVKTISDAKQLLFLHDLLIMKEKALMDIGAGSGIKYKGDLYVLGAGNELIVTMTTMKLNPSFGTSKKSDITVDWGDGVVEKNVFSHTYTDGVQSHNIKFYGSTDALVYLYCSRNQLTSLNVSKSIALTTLYCDTNQFTSLDISKNIALTNLYCGRNQLTSLDVSKNIDLTYLSCDINQLTSLDVSKNIALATLGCGNNKLASLDVSKNTALKELSCDHNQLAGLDASKNIALTFLSCDINQLTSLDISKNTVLNYLSCSNNPLITNQSALIAFANSLPNCTGETAGRLQIQNITSAAWIKDICDAKNWTVA